MKVILDALARHCANRPREVAIIDQDGRMTDWFSLADRVSRIATAVDRLALPAAPVALSLPSGSSLWATVLGIASAGRIPVLLPHPLPQSIADRLLADVGKVVLFDPAMADAAQRENPSPCGTLPPAGVIVLSSGTTGHSRFIFRSSDAVDHVATTLVQEGLVIPSDISSSFIPMSHAYGFEHSFLAPILVGAQVRVLGTFTIPSVAQQLATGATSLALVPFAAAMLCEHAPPAPSLRSIVVAGAALSASIRASLERTFRIRVVDLYGASEVGTIWIDRGSGAQPVSGVTVRIVDPLETSSLNDLPNGCEGEIAVRSNAMGSAILVNTGTLAPLAVDGFFRTGDLGVRATKGSFRITGRTKLVFNVGGLKVNPIEIEQVIETHPSVRRALVSPVRLREDLNRVGVQIEVRPGTLAPSIEELRTFLAPLVAAHALPRTLNIVDALATTESNKLIRLPKAFPISPVLSRPNGLQSKVERDAYTTKLFNDSAQGYDASSGTSFLGRGRWYRRRKLVEAGVRSGVAHLDIGSGTGLCASIAQEIVGPSGRVVALDPSPEMLAVARQRGVRETVIADAESLPFEDRSFDSISMCYMLRHIDDLSIAFTEARRVLRPGGKILILEVTRPSGSISGCAFHIAMNWCAPSIGVIASARPSTFRMMRYWSQTIDQAIPPSQIVAALDHCGFVGTRHRSELGIFSHYRGSTPRA